MLVLTNSKAGASWLMRFAVMALLTLGPPTALGQVPTTLTDKVYKGQGVINLLKDVSGGQLSNFIQPDGTLFLGVDLNEDQKGNETRDSLGIAIKQVELFISTSAGDFTFSDFYTSTSASILEAGASSAQEFYTLFGKSGSSQITGSTGSNLGNLDDVLQVRNINVSGTITRAELRVKFLDTANTGIEGNETFFDWSNGFEDFALLGREDAALLEAANFGVSAAPGNISFSGGGGSSTVPGAPAPPLLLAAAMVVLLLLRKGNHAKA
jgi:hypothetical protein